MGSASGGDPIGSPVMCSVCCGGGCMACGVKG